MNGRWWQRFALRCWVLMVVLFLIAPMLVVVPLSFDQSSLLLFPPEQWSLRWYQSYFHSETWWQATWHSVIIACGVVAVSLVTGSVAAYALVRGQFFGQRWLRALVLMPLVVPGIVTALAIYQWFSQWHLVGSWLGFIWAHSLLAIPFVIHIMSASFQQIDLNLEQAAQSLGAKRWQLAWYVVLPLSWPGLLSAGLFAFLISFDELMIALFLSTPELATLPKQIWAGIRLSLDPTIAAVSSLLLLVSTVIVLATLRLTSANEKSK